MKEEKKQSPVKPKKVIDLDLAGYRILNITLKIVLTPEIIRKPRDLLHHVLWMGCSEDYI